MFGYTCIAALFIILQIILSIRSYIKTGVNEFIFIFFSELIQLIILYIIGAAMVTDLVNISYKQVVFYFNLITIYFYFKACSSINSKNVIFNKAIVKSAAISLLSCFFCFFVAWFEVMLVGIKDTDVVAYCTTEVFCEFFCKFTTIELRYLHVYIDFQVFTLGLSIILTCIFSTRKFRDAASLSGQILAIILELIILGDIHALSAIPYLYVAIIATCIISNQIAYFRENYHITMITKYLLMYKQKRISESALGMTLTSYLISTNMSKSAQYIFQLFGENELYDKLKSEHF